MAHDEHSNAARWLDAREMSAWRAYIQTTTDLAAEVTDGLDQGSTEVTVTDVAERWGLGAAVVGEIGLWVAAASLGWTIFKRRKALIDRVFRRKPREV